MKMQNMPFNTADWAQIPAEEKTAGGEVVYCGLIQNEDFYFDF